MIGLISLVRSESKKEDLKRRILEATNYDGLELMICRGGPDDSICTIYNSAAEKVKANILVFAHDDISFLDSNWAKKIEETLSHYPDAILGIAGTKVYSNVMGTWPSLREFTREDVYHNGNHYYHNPDAEDLEGVMVLDGSFIACRRQVWESVRFSDYLQGYHYYDIDFCLRAIQKNFQPKVFYGLKIDHHSSGSLNAQWVRQTFFMQKLWSSSMPKTDIELTNEQLVTIKRLKVNELINAICFAPKLWLPFHLLSIFFLNKALINRAELIVSIRCIFLGSMYSPANKLLSSITRPFKQTKLA